MSAIADVADITTAGSQPAKQSDARQDTLKFAEAALTDSKREGLLLAVRARWVALAVTAATLPIINPEWEVLYYVLMLGLFALIGWAQLKVGKAERSWPELILIFCDLLLMTFLTVVPNPWSTVDWPLAMQYRFDSFIYFFVFLGTATLAYSWRTVVAMGFWTSALWAIGVGWVYLQPQTHAALSERVRAAVGSDVRLFDIIDPSSIGFGARFQQITVFLIVAMTLALAARRSNALLISHAGIERERTNLARYFSPNVVEQLSKNDDPLKQVRTQNVAVLFADIVDFTAYADGRSPMLVIGTLRQFHERMEREVFRHLGTLDKYLGDGLMATFGTPFTSDSDAGNALRCAQAMIGSIAELNRERKTRDEPPIQLSIGLHFGQVVLGDIGLNRLEFAVIGSAVNAASRLEALTREYGCALVASDELVQRARAETGSSSDDFLHLVKKPARTIRGLEQPVGIWTRDYEAT
ncbi:adenylate/guanylate cyclase domain-containing protein [Bradyrhizobium sp. AUGA SZCCT0176]|uniref:adenylate/guanylate cyclase domain-containing protein n=1 Tax=Bradyrhizobium sp. AUGA SZCCT0176 TaxID=2807664 RepID=UPI001BA4A753|nr:adenylate/guanylate cyclase domain-containing protein [Bradyrhizobium sp. AUGA SZCCT0176]MBR1224334.1 adenylate/guanylate cyclase domain-containing protein [Bradyrhizobium sp. AUGA SZCCT0176]